MIRIGLIQFPGSNCERETALAVKRADMEPIEFLWNESLTKLRDFDGYILVGGFSYEDRSRAGIIAALDPVIQEIKAQSEEGKPVLGICNGAQILVESGMVPGFLDSTNAKIALTENKRVLDGKILGTGFYNAWVNIRQPKYCHTNAFTRHLTPQQIINLPIAHGEGRFIMPDQVLTQLIEKGLHLFQYCDAAGQIIDNFPVNPNGSMASLAAVSNQAGNILAIMPHPERTPNGDLIFRSMRDYILENEQRKTPSLPLLSNNIKPQPLPKPVDYHECVVKLIITDNHALTVEKTLRKLGFPVTVRRFKHWEIDCDSVSILAEVKKSGVLYSERKEKEVSLSESQEHTLTYLVRPKEDLMGQQTVQILKDHYSIESINQIKSGILWQFTSDNNDIHELIDNILSTNIIGNQYAHECYQYR
ncbi:phosphoribosylformylglycinamidine synthase I [Legionella cardiaca]|uniref:Phosphoribosylformylglycinamidine synthase I n=1 Tax=Legionella cardiaca TaxID=1071983 RepID=A0ABY8APA7_9GAMM|nr:phosphoribosylformylglycinamidine synthase I [Legionella cardiaca]WED42358.1 phosphoribosylformylglycinamidine synthase I [Legionella cardiaca]